MGSTADGLQRIVFSDQETRSIMIIGNYIAHTYTMVYIVCSLNYCSVESYYARATHALHMSYGFVMILIIQKLHYATATLRYDTLPFLTYTIAILSHFTTVNWQCIIKSYLATCSCDFIFYRFSYVYQIREIYTYYLVVPVAVCN